MSCPIIFWNFPIFPCPCHIGCVLCVLCLSHGMTSNTSLKAATDDLSEVKFWFRFRYKSKQNQNKNHHHKTKITWIKLACSGEFGFWEHSKLICWVVKTECGSIPPWMEASSFLNSSSFSSKPEDPRQRFTLTAALVFSSVQISSLTVFFPAQRIISKQARNW